MSESSSRSKAAIAACGGEIDAVLKCLMDLQQTTDYDLESKAALQRYAASAIIKNATSSTKVGNSQGNSQMERMETHQIFCKVMLEMAQTYDQLGQEVNLEKLWRTVAKYKIGRYSSEMARVRAKYERNTAAVKKDPKRIVEAVKILKNFLNDVKNNISESEREAVEQDLQVYLQERDQSSFHGSSSFHGRAPSADGKPAIASSGSSPSEQNSGLAGNNSCSNNSSSGGNPVPNFPSHFPSASSSSSLPHPSASSSSSVPHQGGLHTNVQSSMGGLHTSMGGTNNSITSMRTPVASTAVPSSARMIGRDPPMNGNQHVSGIGSSSNNIQGSGDLNNKKDDQASSERRVFGSARRAIDKSLAQASLGLSQRPTGSLLGFNDDAKKLSSASKNESKQISASLSEQLGQVASSSSMFGGGARQVSTQEKEQALRLEQQRAEEQLQRRQSLSMMICDTTCHTNLSPIFEERERNSTSSDQKGENANGNAGGRLGENAGGNAGGASSSSRAPINDSSNPQNRSNNNAVSGSMNSTGNNAAQSSSSNNPAPQNCYSHSNSGSHHNSNSGSRRSSHHSGSHHSSHHSNSSGNRGLNNQIQRQSQAGGLNLNNQNLNPNQGQQANSGLNQPQFPQQRSVHQHQRPSHMSRNAGVTEQSSDEKTEPSDNVRVIDGHKVMIVNGINYRRVAVVGRGGSSKVFKVLSPEGRELALKRVHVNNIQNNTNHAITQFELFKNEVELLKKLRGNPNVVHMFDSEINEEDLCIQVLMEYGNSDFSRFLQKEPEIQYSTLRKYWRQMLKAVQVVHEQRIVHGDLKPANFLLVHGDDGIPGTKSCPDGIPGTKLCHNSLKLIDFGIAKAIPHEATTNIQRDHQIGTLSYMAPEAVFNSNNGSQGLGGPVKLGRSSDIWSLGIIMYQMVFKKTPFSHLHPMQRILTISDPKTQITFGECPKHLLVDDEDPSIRGGGSRRASGDSKKMDIDNSDNLPPKAWFDLLETMKACLKRDATERASIPELLSNSFLAQNQLILQQHDFKKLLCGGQNSLLKQMREKLIEKWQSSCVGVLKKSSETPSSGTAGTGVGDATNIAAIHTSSLFDDDDEPPEDLFANMESQIANSLWAKLENVYNNGGSSGSNDISNISSSPFPLLEKYFGEIEKKVSQYVESEDRALKRRRIEQEEGGLAIGGGVLQRNQNMGNMQAPSGPPGRRPYTKFQPKSGGAAVGKAFNARAEQKRRALEEIAD